MVLIKRFLFHLLCSVYNCQYEHPAPTPLPPAKESIKTHEDISDHIVHTKTGFVEGFKETIINGDIVMSFEGIPYAEQPIGDLRFKAPVPKQPWKGILQAKSPGPDCLQINPLRLLVTTGREGCLFLNVYVPTRQQCNITGSGPKNFPVIIWIHGGSYFFGAGREYGPAYLLKRDVILVTINYRLGVLGFMSTGDEVSSGNYGLKDQALAIKWVHDNIANFGGDVDRVTLLGQSAGGASVHLHLLSNTSIARGMYRNAASLSGSAFNFWALQSGATARKITKKFAKIMGCPTESGSSAILSCFQKADANFLTAFQRHMFDIILFPVVVFAPVIEPNIVPDAYITDTPENYYARNEVAKVPWLCTNTQEEAEYMLLALDNSGLLINYKIHWKRYLPYIMDIPDDENILDKVTKHYLGNKPPSTASSRSIARMGTDRYFLLGTRRALRHHYKIAPCYSYIFGFRSIVGITNSLSADYRKWGASHTEDLSIIFNSSIYFKAIEREDTSAMKMSDIVVSLITNFATKGEPFYTDDISGKDLYIWEPIKDPDNLQFLRLNFGEIKMIPDPFKERLKIWDQLSIY